jgi:hypothetical protein
MDCKTVHTARKRIRVDGKMIGMDSKKIDTDRKKICLDRKLILLNRGKIGIGSKAIHMDWKLIGSGRKKIHMNGKAIHMIWRAIHITRKTNCAATNTDYAVIHTERDRDPYGNRRSETAATGVEQRQCKMRLPPWMSNSTGT